MPWCRFCWRQPEDCVRRRINAGSPTFEVASVKPGSPAAQGSSVRLTPGGRLVAQNATLQQLITTAYQIRDFQLFGGPSWLTSEHFDIEAKPSQPDRRSGLRHVAGASRGPLRPGDPPRDEGSFGVSPRSCKKGVEPLTFPQDLQSTIQAGQTGGIQVARRRCR